MTMSDPMKAALTEVQQRRVLALESARNVLATKNIWAGSNVQGWTIGDLVYVAGWVLEGSQPETEDGETEDGERTAPATAELPRLVPVDPALVTGADLEMEAEADEDDSYVPPTRDWDPPKD